MDDTRLGRLVRIVRQRRGWRQTDLAAKAGVGRTVISEIEYGRLEGIGIAKIRKVVGMFGLSVEITIRGLGADGDRLLDEHHAAPLGACASWLRSLGWLTAAEVSYSEWGERGSVDLLAWHAPTLTLLVVEIKTELVSVEATLRKLDEKVRLGPTIARPLGWRPTSVSRLLVMPDDRTEHRRVALNESVMIGAYPMRTREVRRCCRSPVGPMSGLMFLPNAATSGRKAARARQQRVQVARRPIS